MNTYLPITILNYLILMQKYVSTKDETRPALQGLKLEVTDDTLKAVATDGHIMLIREFFITVDMASSLVLFNEQVIKFHDTKKIKPNDKREFSELFHTVNREYPNYKAVIPKTPTDCDKNEYFAINPMQLYRLAKALGSTDKEPVIFDFYGVKSRACIEIKTKELAPNIKNTILIMPVITARMK